MTCRKDLDTQLIDLQRHLGSSQGKQYWRSLDELAGTEAFQKLMRREFPAQATVWPDSLSRRKFLSLMGASLALAGLSGCSVRPAPEGEIVPYVRPPEEVVPGRPLFFATAMTLGGAAVGLLVENHMGRPTKIEGNPDHPASRGATDLYSQASVLDLYDPDRSQTVTHLGQARTWEEASQAIATAIQSQRSKKGAGFRLLTEEISSPTLIRQIEDLLKELPQAKWHIYEPLADDMAYRGSQLAFGQAVRPVFDFRGADIVLALDADFLGCSPGSLAYAADFMDRRRVRTTEKDAGKALMNRLYVVETTVSCTGAKADHRLALRLTEIEAFARAVAARLGIGGKASEHAAGPHEKWIAAVAKDLEAHRGHSLVLAGESQPPVVHLLAHAMNDRLGNVGQTVRYIEPIHARPGDRTQLLRELADDMQHGRVELLVIVGGNPVYGVPADLDFPGQMRKVPLCVHHSLYQDETSLECHWHLPVAHYLEAWGDARAYDGTASIQQPLIAPLYQGRSAQELLAMLAGQPVSGYQAVREYWRGIWKDRQKGENDKDSFEAFWQTSVHDGVVRDTAFKSKTVSLQAGWEKHLASDPSREPAKPSAKTAEGKRDRPQEFFDVLKSGQPPQPSTGPEAANLEIVFRPDPTLHDGRFANNGWLQECPKPVTRLAWGNAVLMSPRTAARLNVKPGAYAHGGEHGGRYMPVVELHLGGRRVRGPAWILPGHADDAVTVYLGNGRKHAGRVGGIATAEGSQEWMGFDAYPLRTSALPWFATGLEVVHTGESELVVCTQEHHLMENRDVVRSANLEEYHKHPRFVADREKEHDPEAKPPNFYPPHDYRPPEHKWGMSIDLTACVGCQACVVACQSENNIPVVGREQVAFGREMHWLRVDRYTSGPGEMPSEFHFQPVPCMHCENAPCEYVCPVEATVHSADGLNDMMYQRCVGTRFCSNNCPYKVRRFNFFQYADFETPSRRLQYNPDVTVRSRGVMEKCTYCVQRIRQAEIGAEKENRPIADGEVLTACQAACPTKAIVFGDINDPKSEVRRCKESPLDYGLLADLNTQPRTTYLAELRNPNPELEVQ